MAEALAYNEVQAMGVADGPAVHEAGEVPAPGANTPGAQAMAARLVAGGWTPAQARTLAAAIVADRRCLTFEGWAAVGESVVA
jgi:hypothetical protein